MVFIVASDSMYRVAALCLLIAPFAHGQVRLEFEVASAIRN